MSTVIKPTIGRVVWYFGSTADTTPRAAIICHVHNDHLECREHRFIGLTRDAIDARVMSEGACELPDCRHRLCECGHAECHHADENVQPNCSECGCSGFRDVNTVGVEK